MSEQLITTPGTFGENDNFVLERELGKGGMGGVYMGRDKMLDRPIALKVMLPEYGSDAAFVEKFKREAQAAARLIHPNIAQVYSYGISQGMPYIAMELVCGGSLEALMRNAPGATDVPRVMKICMQVAQALRCAADQGLVHGDVKPENILLDANGNAKLVDFGLAAMQKDTDEIWGTPYYIAPEKVRREEVDYRADMYSLGGTLYHALTGVAPFEGEDAVQVVRKRFEGAPRLPSEVRPGLSPQIDQLVMTMLAVDKNNRYPSFEALIDEFNKVMTVGLSTTQPVSGAAAGATTVKRKTLSTRRTVKLRRPSAVAASAAAGEEEPSASVAPAPKPQPEEDESGGSVGTKILVGILSIILVVGGLGGGLAWYIASNRSSRAAAKQSQVTANIAKSREAIAATSAAVTKFGENVEEFAKNATEDCQKTTDELAKILPKFAAALKPAPTKELLDALALENPPAETNAAEAAAAPAEAAKPAAEAVAKAAPAKPAADPKRFPPPTEEESDPNSPEGEEYLRKKAEFEAKLAQGTAEPAVAPEPAPAAAATDDEPPPTVVHDMQELWERAYSCQAAAIRIRIGVRETLAFCAEAEKETGTDEAAMNRLAQRSREAVEKYENLRMSKDVETIQKGSGYIKSRGSKFVKQTVDRLLVERNQREREQKRAEEAEAAKKRAEEAAAAKAKLIADETEQARARFTEIAKSGCLRVLEWDTALRNLEYFKVGLKTAEGQLAVDDELRKVKAMKGVQDIFVRNLKGYTFRKSALAKNGGWKVEEVTEDEIKLVRADGKKRMKLTWVSFYQKYHANLNELVNQFVVQGRRNGKPRLNLREWADAMCGAALTMRLLCGDDPSALSRGEDIAKMVYAQYEDYQKYVRGMFPDIDFSAVAAADEE